MNPFIWPATCSICGEKGMAASGDAYMFGAAHRDPNVCREVLATKAEKLKIREEKLLKLEKEITS